MDTKFPENTVFVVVILVPEVGKKKLMIARIIDDDNYEKNRNSFLTKMMLKCRVERAYIEDIQTIHSREELDALKKCFQRSQDEK